MELIRNERSPRRPVRAVTWPPSASGVQRAQRRRRSPVPPAVGTRRRRRLPVAELVRRTPDASVGRGQQPRVRARIFTADVMDRIVEYMRAATRTACTDRHQRAELPPARRPAPPWFMPRARNRPHPLRIVPATPCLHRAGIFDLSQHKPLDPGLAKVSALPPQSCRSRRKEGRPLLEGLPPAFSAAASRAAGRPAAGRGQAPDLLRKQLHVPSTWASSHTRSDGSPRPAESAADRVVHGLALGLGSTAE
jgi:hypothetical protein